MRKTTKDWVDDPLIEKIAAVCYAAIREWCIQTKQPIDYPWENLSPAYRTHVKIVVARCFADMTVPSGKVLHQRCMKEGMDGGWTYGEVVDKAKKRHPDILPWEKLSMEQRIKEHIFSAVIKSFFEGT